MSVMPVNIRNEYKAETQPKLLKARMKIRMKQIDMKPVNNTRIDKKP